MTDILHLTLDTGDSYRSARTDVSDDMVALAATILYRALHRPATPPQTAAMLRGRGGEIGVAVLDIALDALRPAMIMPDRSRYSQWTLSGGTEGRSLLCSVIGPPGMDRAPVLSFGVAPTSHSALRPWQSLMRTYDGRGPVTGNPDSPPAPPWLATRMEIGAALVPPSDRGIFPILADFQRCVAWAWIEWIERQW